MDGMEGVGGLDGPADGRSAPLVDARLVGKPEKIGAQPDIEIRWPDWKFRMANVMACVDFAYVSELAGAGVSEIVLDSTGWPDAMAKRSVTLYAVLASLTERRCLKVVRRVAARQRRLRLG